MVIHLLSKVCPPSMNNNLSKLWTLDMHEERRWYLVENNELTHWPHIGNQFKIIRNIQLQLPASSALQLLLIEILQEVENMDTRYSTHHKTFFGLEMEFIIIMF